MRAQRAALRETVLQYGRQIGWPARTAIVFTERATRRPWKRAALARIDLSHRASLDQSRAGQGSAGVARDATTTDGKPVQQSGEKKARNDHRPPKRVRTGPHQATLFDQADAREDASDAKSPPDEAEGGEAMEKGEPLA